MAGIGETIYYADKAAFSWLQDSLLAEWLGPSGIYWGNVFFWTPFFIFIGVLMIQAKPKRGGWNAFFSLGAVVIAYQAAVLFSSTIQHPPPYVFAAHEGIVLPAFTYEASYSLPDWPVAVFAAAIAIISGRLRRYRRPLPWLIHSTVILFSLFRILAGYAFPLDAVTSIVLGNMIGFLVGKVAEGVEVILDGQE